MKNKRILILTILLAILLIVIPIIVLATKEAMQMPILTDETIEEANQKERERLLEEKRKFEEEHKNESSSDKPVAYSSENVTERDEMIDNARNEVIKKEEKRIEIINRYYPEEYGRIQDKLAKEMKNDDIIEIYSTVSEGRKELYELIFKILDEKELNEEDTNVLKDFIANNLSDIKNDEQLKVKVENILK